MPIAASAIKTYLSGGGGNSDPLLSLGSTISATELTSAVLHALYDVVSGAEASAGDTEYRCIYVKNTDSVTSGSFVTGTEYTILTAGSTDFTLIGAADSNPGTTFTATGAGTGSGTAGRTLQAAKVYIKTQTPSTDSSFEIGLDNAGVNGVAYNGTGSSEGTAPPNANPGVTTWQAGVGLGNALTIGDIPAGQHQAIWCKRIISPGAAAYSADSAELTYSGDTAS